MKFILAGAAILAAAVIAGMLHTAKEKKKDSGAVESLLASGKASTDLLKELRAKAYL